MNKNHYNDYVNINNIIIHSTIMNALAVQNPRHKCDLGNNLRTIQSPTRKQLKVAATTSVVLHFKL